MFEKLSEFWKSRFVHTWWHELRRLASMGIVILGCFYPDWAALHTTMFIVGVFFAVALISHLVRKYALFPYINMRQFAVKSLEEPLAASIVFASVTSVIVVSITTAATFFAK